tara:strand:+ start:145 stop:1245 length:1101 start_codon:yes stop_codon:yes gene_type:complete
MELKFDKYNEFRIKSLFGRYITNESILQLTEIPPYSEAGKSSNNLPIYYLKLGSGPIKILIWSQMHGNESTSTKALFDALSYFLHIDKKHLSDFTLHIIPILNPDGALLYTRENFNKIDLNRDASSLSQNESVVLRNLYDKIKPHYCFNLHDQRSIYSVADTNKPSVLSFLSPASDTNKSETNSRITSMKVISSINKELSSLIKGHMSRYKDDYNPNCVGDTFQSLNTPTLLFESGHFDNDYNRENTRKYMCFALITAITSITTNEYKKIDYSDYYKIPENTTYLSDIFLRNVLINTGIKEYRTNISIMYKEVLDISSNKIKLEPFIDKKGLLKNMFGHFEIDFTNNDEIFKNDDNLLNNLLKNIN